MLFEITLQTLGNCWFRKYVIEDFGIEIRVDFLDLFLLLHKLMIHWSNNINLVLSNMGNEIHN